MKINLKRMFVMLLVFVLLISTSVTSVYATTYPEIHHEKIGQSEDQANITMQHLSSMSIDELEQIIAVLALEEPSRVIPQTLQSAWLAAAAIANKKGYPLAATLVVHSVLGIDYKETDGAFSRAIKKTSLFRQMIKSGSGKATFTKEMNKDLYYSLHKVSYFYSTNHGPELYVCDRFNFKLETVYEDLFSNIVNNWAYLSQFIGVLHDVGVTITMRV